MVNFIKQHGIEEVDRINKSSKDEYTKQMSEYVEAEKDKITQNYKNDLANKEVQLKIEKSKQQNSQRIEKMRKVN
jgi:vacuolar-type H+-ATPase subunit E/Vma4